MKTRIIAFIAPVLFALTACTDTQVSPTSVTNTLKSGTWKISFYWDTDHEETGDFANYHFIFSPNNVLTANDGTNTVTGTWYVTDTGDDQETDLVLYLGASFPFIALNEDWQILEKSSTRVHMRHSDGSGTDLLTFQKL